MGINAIETVKQGLKRGLALLLSVPCLASANSSLDIVPVIAEYVEATKYSYYVKVVDLNGDSMEDLYITGGYARTVPDFAILRNGACSYTLVPFPTTSQRNTADGVEASVDAHVIRQDLNFDALYDFHISGLEYETPGACDVLVSTVLGDGTQVDKLVPVDSAFEDLENEIEQIVRHAAQRIGIYDNGIGACVTVPSPVLNYDYFRQGWVWGSYLTETCLQFDGPTVISAMHSPLASQWCSTLSHGNAVFGTGGLSATGINLNNLLLSKFSPNQIIASVNTARGTLQLARAYTTAAAFVLVADNVTIVGVADDIALIPILGAFGVTVALEHVLDDIQDRLVLMAQTDNPDIAERDKDGTETVSFAISDNCDPGQNGASQNLRRNMKKAGCLCEDVPFKNGTDVQAHHIVPKGITTDTAKALRSCLERKQIRIHDAVNGVCLPNDLELASKTRAYRHITGGDLHSENVLSVLLKRCESMSPSEFRAYLREVADLYTIGAVPI